jgi:hypothetical protein
MYRFWPGFCFHPRHMAKGIVNDSTYRQNPLVRLLEKLLIF